MSSDATALAPDWLGSQEGRATLSHPTSFEILRLLFADWRKVYRYHSIGAAAACLLGSRRLRRLPVRLDSVLDSTEVVTFSVVPRLTSLWLATAEAALAGSSPRFLIGDCSGALRRFLKPVGSNVEIIPMLNQHHGEKLDLFLYRICRSELVVICDDDILWLGPEPLVWAREQLERDDGLAVVGVLPKATTSSVLKGKVEHPMGSLLVLRRSIWMREGLSFRVRNPDPAEGFRWIYDTGEYAQVELLRRGYRVLLGGPDVRGQLVDFEALSSWTMKMQKRSGDISDSLENIPLRQEKAWRVVLAARGLAELVRERCDQCVSPHLVSPALLDRSEEICRRLLSPVRADEIQREVEALLSKLSQRSKEVDFASCLA